MIHKKGKQMKKTGKNNFKPTIFFILLTVALAILPQSTVHIPAAHTQTLSGDDFESEGFPSGSDLPITLSDYATVAETNPVEGAWAIIGPKNKIPQMQNLFWLFDNQTIQYTHLYPNEVTNYEDIKNYVGLITWTNSESAYNFTAVKLFAETRPVISHIFDFCHFLYPTLSESIRVVSTTNINYLMDWGNFRQNDRAEMHNGAYSLTTVISSNLVAFTNITVIANCGTTQAAIFHMAGANSNAGFYVMDLHATRPNSYESGNYHLFPAIAKAATITAGQYSRWMTNGLSWQSLDWVYSWMINFTNINSDVVTMKSIGTSVQGRPINALFIGHGTRYFIADGAIHGNEKDGTHGLIRFAELLIDWYHTYPSWQTKLNQYKIILIPVLNPDGYVNNTRENANGKDLNRQFPPAATTTEPEAWALRWLMGNYTPTQYVNLHIGGQNYPLDIFYTGSSISPYGTYTRCALNEGDLLFQDLKHWGTVYDAIWVGKYHRNSSQGTQSSLSAPYAFYAYRAAAFTVEHWGGSRANLHSQEYYISTLLALLQHYDSPDGFIIHSNAMIAEATYTNTSGLHLNINATYIAANRISETIIYDFNNLGKPLNIYIDGILKAEGDNWFWNNSTNTTTVTGATQSILLAWHLTPPSDPEVTTPTDSTISPIEFPDTHGNNQTVSNMVHDIIITNMTISPPTVNQGETTKISIAILNNGTQTEISSLTLHANNMLIVTQQITLQPNNITNITLLWNTVNITEGNYTLTAHIQPITNETNIANNTFKIIGIQIIGAYENNQEKPLLIIITASALLIATLLLLILAQRIKRHLKKPSNNKT